MGVAGDLPFWPSMTSVNPHIQTSPNDMPVWLGEETAAVGKESAAVSRAFEIFLNEYFIPVSRESIPYIRFHRLKEKWEAETAFLSTVSDIVMHPAYQHHALATQALDAGKQIYGVETRDINNITRFNTCYHCLPVVRTADFHDDPHVNQYPDALNRRPLENREGGAVMHRGTEPLLFPVATPSHAKRYGSTSSPSRPARPDPGCFHISALT